jgi:hypothetical protein
MEIYRQLTRLRIHRVWVSSHPWRTLWVVVALSKHLACALRQPALIRSWRPLYYLGPPVPYGAQASSQPKRLLTRHVWLSSPPVSIHPALFEGLLRGLVYWSFPQVRSIFRQFLFLLRASAPVEKRAWFLQELWRWRRPSRMPPSHSVPLVAPLRSALNPLGFASSAFRSPVAAPWRMQLWPFSVAL